MHIERDTEFDLLYISLVDGAEEGAVTRTKEVFPGVLFDLDTEGKILGIEFTNTQKALGISASDLHLSGELLGVKEAAELAGKDRGNFIRDLARKPDFPEPVAQLASGQIWLSKDIESYLQKRDSSTNNAACKEVQYEEQAPDSVSHEGGYEYEGGGEADATVESSEDQGFYPNQGGSDHEPYDSGNYDRHYRGESA
ncbi:MAG: DUF2283 domain-containing protein [Blastocatellia bacterium]|nr:DUF2283 domain-containing protein [Blastocatellia bacterium]